MMSNQDKKKHKLGKNNSIPNDIQFHTDSSVQICLTILLI